MNQVNEREQNPSVQPKDRFTATFTPIRWIVSGVWMLLVVLATRTLEGAGTLLTIPLLALPWLACYLYDASEDGKGPITVFDITMLMLFAGPAASSLAGILVMLCLAPFFRIF